MLRKFCILLLFFSLAILPGSAQMIGVPQNTGQQQSAGVSPSGIPQQLPTDVFYDIYDFSALLQSHMNPFEMPKGSAFDAYNVRVNSQYGSLGKRPPLTLLGTCSHSASVTGLYRFYTSAGTKQTVTSSGDYLDYISDSGSCTNLYQWPTAGLRANFITYKDQMIGTDGNDLPIKWDGSLQTTADTAGSRSAGYLVAQLGAPYATLAAGAGLTASKWYHYVMAYYNGTNYTFTYSQSNPLQMGATNNKQVTLSNVPLGPPGTTDRYVYRTLADNTATASIADTTYYLDKHLADNATTTYVDSSSDSTISTGPPTPTWSTVSAGVNVSTPHGYYPFIQNDYIWLAADPSGVAYGLSNVYFSQVLNADYWYPTNFFLIRPDDGDSIQGITSFLGQLWIPKTNSWTQIYTNSNVTTNWSVSQPFSFIGVTAPYSIVSTPIGIFYLGRYGLYNFNGQSSSIISDVVTKDFRDINTVNSNNISATFYNNEYRLAYPSLATGAQTNNRVLLYDTVRNAYVKDTENINIWTGLNSGSDFGGLISGSSGTDGSILSHSTQPSSVVIQYLSDLNAGTFSYTGTVGTQNAPILELTSSAWSADNSSWNADASTWQVDASPGTWLSPPFQINATNLSQLVWNASTPTGTSITLAVRVAATSSGITGASWSTEFTNPNGSDISAVSGNVWIQIRATLSTSNLSVTPYLQNLDNYVIQLFYSSNGVNYELSVPSTWISGWMDMVPSIYMGYLAHYPKVIKEIDVYYTGSLGTMNVNLQNLKGDSVANFNIDLSQSTDQTPGSPYWGYGTTKVYTWLPSNGGGASPPPFGDRFQLTITENGVTSWLVQKVRIRYDCSNYLPFH